MVQFSCKLLFCAQFRRDSHPIENILQCYVFLLVPFALEFSQSVWSSFTWIAATSKAENTERQNQLANTRFVFASFSTKYFRPFRLKKRLSKKLNVAQIKNVVTSALDVDRRAGNHRLHTLAAHPVATRHCHTTARSTIQCTLPQCMFHHRSTGHCHTTACSTT